MQSRQGDSKDKGEPQNKPFEPTAVPQTVPIGAARIRKSCEHGVSPAQRWPNAWDCSVTQLFVPQLCHLDGLQQAREKHEHDEAELLTLFFRVSKICHDKQRRGRWKSNLPSMPCARVECGHCHTRTDHIEPVLPARR